MSAVRFHSLLAEDLAPRWEFLGPRKLPVPDRMYHGEGMVSGRVNGVAFDPKDPNVIYVAAAGGGFWKSTDRGESWTCLSDTWENVKFSSVAVHPKDSNTIIVGTGDYSGAHGYGYGLMMTTDGGVNWRNLLQDELRWYNVSQILFDPDDPNIITVTAGRHPREAGKILRSENGGRNWSPANIPVTTPTDWSNVQVSLREGNGQRNYYAVGVRSGNNYAMAGLRGDWDCGAVEIWHSVDHGRHWTRLAGPQVIGPPQPPGTAPQGDCMVNVDVAPSPSSPRRVYLVAASYSDPDEAHPGQVWVSHDAGSQWTDITSNFPHQFVGKHADNWSQSDYNFYIRSVKNPATGQDIIYVGLIDLAASIDGGRSWRSVGEVFSADAKTHSDQHALAVNPRDPNDLLVGNDGGVYRLTFDPARKSWKFQSHLNAGLGMTMFYRIAVDPSNPDWVLGGAQDNATPVSMGNLAEWSNKGLDDGGFCVINPQTPRIQYATSQYLSVYRTDDGWASFKPITQVRDVVVNGRKDELRWEGDRVGFIAPIALDPTDPNKLYAATNHLWRWDEGRQEWTPRLGNQRLTTGNGWVSYIAIAPKDGNRIYTGSNLGDLWMTTDAGNTWRRIDNDRLPSAIPSLPITSIAVHPTNPDSILVAFGSVGRDGHLWRCDNTRAGEPRWRQVGAGQDILESVALYDIVIDPRRPDSTYYIGTDVGVFLTNDGGRTWANFGTPLGLPNVRVSDLELLRDNSHLVTATYGRGAWRLQLPGGAEPLYFKPPEQARWRFGRARRVRRR